MRRMAGRTFSFCRRLVGDVAAEVVTGEAEGLLRLIEERFFVRCMRRVACRAVARLERLVHRLFGLDVVAGEAEIGLLDRLAGMARRAVGDRRMRNGAQ